jgi:hypothetical protein
VSEAAASEATGRDGDLFARLVALLDRLAGPGEGRALLQRLLRSDEPPVQIARSIAASGAFAFLYKEARTGNIGVEGSKEADPGFAGLADMPAGLSFEAQFYQHFAPRLGKRADGFAAIFAALPRRDPVIIETGCMRIPDNWEGDGQSSFMFDAFARATGGLFFSVDITPEAVDTARRACSSAAQLILNDSVAALDALARALPPRRASLLYLDSFDVNVANPLPSAIHHALELAAARPLIGPGTVVAVDDYGLGTEGGKGMILDMFFSAIRAEVLYAGYQKVWRVA